MQGSQNQSTPLSDNDAAALNLQSICLILPPGMHFKDIFKGFFDFEYRRIRMYQSQDGFLRANVLFKDFERAKNVKNRTLQQVPAMHVEWPRNGDFLPREFFYKKPTNPTHVLEFLLPDILPKDEWTGVLTHCWNATIIADPRDFPESDKTHRVYAQFAKLDEAEACHYFVNTKTLIRANIISIRSRRPNVASSSPQAQSYIPSYDDTYTPPYVGSRRSRRSMSPPSTRPQPHAIDLSHAQYHIVEKSEMPPPPPPPIRRQHNSPTQRRGRSVSPRRSPPSTRRPLLQRRSPPLPRRRYPYDSPTATIESSHNTPSSAPTNSDNSPSYNNTFDTTKVLDSIPAPLLKPLFQQFLNTLLQQPSTAIVESTSPHQQADNFLHSMNLMRTPPKQTPTEPPQPMEEVEGARSKYWPSPGIPTNILYVMGLPETYDMNQIWAPYTPEYIHLRRSKTRNCVYLFAEFNTVEEVKIVLWHNTGLEVEGKPILTGYGKLNE